MRTSFMFGPCRFELDLPDSWDLRELSQDFYQTGGVFMITQRRPRFVNLIVGAHQMDVIEPDSRRAGLEMFARSEGMEVKSSRVCPELSLCGSGNSVLLTARRAGTTMSKLSCVLGRIEFDFTFYDDRQSHEAVRQIVESCALVQGRECIDNVERLDSIRLPAELMGRGAPRTPAAGAPNSLLYLLLAVAATVLLTLSLRRLPRECLSAWRVWSFPFLVYLCLGLYTQLPRAVYGSFLDLPRFRNLRGAPPSRKVWAGLKWAAVAVLFWPIHFARAAPSLIALLVAGAGVLCPYVMCAIETTPGEGACVLGSGAAFALFLARPGKRRFFSVPVAMVLLVLVVYFFAIGQAALEAMSALRQGAEADRVRAAHALGEMAVKGRRVATVLRDSLTRDTPAPVKRALIEGLERIVRYRGGQKNVEAIASALEDADPGLRLAAVEALGRLGGRAKAALAPLRKRAEDQDPAVRNAAKAAAEKVDQDKKRE